MNLALRWRQIIHDPLFQNVPFKVELNRFGQILMSPASNWHGVAQGALNKVILKKKRRGTIINECSVMTREGVRVADVAWASEAFMKKHGYATPYPMAPEVCIEVYSPSNTREEIDGKADLYLLAGAHEVWVVRPGAPVQIITHNHVVLPESDLFGSIKLRM